MEQEKNTQHNEQTIFFMGTILKEQWDFVEHKKNIGTINAGINKKTF